MNITQPFKPAAGRPTSGLILEAINPFGARPAYHWLALVLMALVVLAMLWFGQALHQTLALVGAPVVQAPSGGYAVRTEALNPPEYEGVARVIKRLHPDVQVSVVRHGNTTGLALAIDHPARHAEFLFALAALNARDASIIWDAQQLCIGRCEGQGVAQAFVVAYRQQVADAR